MTLYLHIGTEKTGSSYLQSLAAQNREQLREAGIHFPSAGKRDAQMLRGKISAGNAQPLTDAIRSDNWLVVETLLLQWIKEAQAQHCHSLLLSNELLVLALALPGRLEQLNQRTTSLGIRDTQAILILRDPVEQALSLYKHRAKSGSALPIEEWPEIHYHYGKGLFDFLQEAESSDLTLKVRKYRKQGLEDVFFRQWLGVKIDMSPVKRVVNPSLSLSELLLIRQLYQEDKWLPRFLYERLLPLSSHQKAPEPKLSQYYKAVLSEHLSSYQASWELCNTHLPEDEQLDIPVSSGQAVALSEKVLTFSPAQGELISRFIRESASLTFWWKLRFRAYKHRLGRLRNRIFSPKRKA